MNSEAITFTFVGHVDHGKSTLAGHLLYKSQFITQDEFDKIERKAYQDKMTSQKYSRILDIFQEEQDKGKTHEFTNMEFNYDGNKFELIDTPGHKQFIRSMISGIFKSDKSPIGCLVVSAIPNEFESGFERGQTKEDIILLRSVGIDKLIILINKMDKIEWNQKLYDEYVSKITKYAKNFNFKVITSLPVSGFEGIGLINNDKYPEWYDGDCLINAIIRTNKVQSDVTKNDPTIYATKTIIASFTILSPIPLITTGYKGICHYFGGEVEFEIMSLTKTKHHKKSNKNIGKLHEKLEVTIELEKIIDISKGSKLLFRSNENTVGFGTLLKLKPIVKKN